ncbi:MAG: helix-hairpin-helix domain-containing protein [Smithellaceae bacterium]|nr:helix-hairpin-helix domain-containing protein [Smithellaceae bacterium]
MEKKITAILVILLALTFATTSIAADTKAVKPTTAPAVAAPAKAPAKPEMKVPAKMPAKAELVDINSATKEQLMALSLTDADAQKVIAGRPYAKKDQLKIKKIIPDASYEKIKDKIIAKRAAKPKK